MEDIIIIGAGVSGCAIARELSRKKADILVVDRAEDVCCGTTKANSAIIHAGYDAKHGTLMAKLNVLGSQMMPQLAKELDFPYQRNGSLVVMTDPENRPQLEAVYANGIANGVEGLRIVEREELLQLEPNVSDAAVAALYAPTGAIVCPFSMTYALAENAAKNGVRFRFNPCVKNIQKTAGGWRIVTNQGNLEAKVVINAAGVYADTLHNMVSSDEMTIVPRRGEYFLLDRVVTGYVRHTVFQLPGKLGKGVLISPTVHGNTLVGPTATDVEDKEDVATTAAGLAFLREKAPLAVKTLPLRQINTSFSGMRDHELRHEFFIGEAAPGFVDCAGIESPGLSSAPAIAQMVSRIVCSILPLRDNPNFDPERKGIVDPRKLTFQQRAELIARQPAYGNVICRCESITEGEILDAIHRTPGARSIDGVKRRTRAGMGRCQGGFCSPKVMEILARERKIPVEAVTKCGGDSGIIQQKNKEGML